MFALGLRYLNGWSMAASDGARKERAEWPPHPDRVFMALAAAWFETDEDEEEGDALRWLEALSPPSIAASEATLRLPVKSYVPVNDDARPVVWDSQKKQWKRRPEGTLPLGRVRQPRGFPVVIPHDPVLYMIWDADLGKHSPPLERLATRLSHVGHPASFVQAWVEQGCISDISWEPTEGVSALRLRVPSPCRLEQLARPHREAWSTFHSHLSDIEQAEADLEGMKPPPRVAWRSSFPNAVLLATESDTKQHPQYVAAKSGDHSAAERLVDSLAARAELTAVCDLLQASGSAPPAFVCVHAYEREGVNAIPAALSEWLSLRLDVPFVSEIVQSNVVTHTGADGYGRLARQARFEGDIHAGREYLMVDDFIGQGGTLANLRGWIEKNGGKVIGAVVLTGKPYSAKLSPTKEQLHELRKKHGSDFEKWWRTRFGHAFNCLTQSEARYLTRSPDADTIRNRLAEAKCEGDRRGSARSVREQKQYIRKLKSRRISAPSRPATSRWQGYAPPRQAESDEPPHSVFDPRIVVLTIQGRRVSLPATLKLTAALRGLLMRECPLQPPPEWFSGHRDDGKPTVSPHMALAPLPFVGAPHADGRIMGLAMILPRELNPADAGRGLDSILHDPATGLPRPHRLFNGQWLECTIELDARERPPVNLAPQTWVSRSRAWASVTPVVLNRHFDGEDRWTRAAESLKDACRHIGLPRPAEVLLHPVSSVEGAPHAREFPRLTRKRDNGRQSHAHAEIVFDAPVTGPVLVGAGRFRGYGLCRPLDPP